jgi:predicted DNA-binding protein
VSNEEQVSIRLPVELLARAEKLAPQIATAPGMAAFRVTRAAVLRMALERGLLLLEKEQGKRKR